MGLAACGYCFTSYAAYSIKKGDDKWILVHWVWIEAVSFPFIILYGLLQRYYLKRNCLEKQEEAILKKREGMEVEMGDMDGANGKVSAQEGLLNKEDDKTLE